jgi:hypothetical protein
LEQNAKTLRNVVCILATPRILSAPDESLLSSIVSTAFKCLQELRISFLSVFLFLPPFSFGLLLLLLSLGFALSALRVLVELVLVNLLLLWFSVSV